MFVGVLARAKPPLAPFCAETKRALTRAERRRRMTTGLVETLPAISAEGTATPWRKAK